jgi:transcriptional regulator EpsA
MLDPAFLPDEADVSCLIATIAECARIQRRSQYFEWAQSHLQTLLPHGLLLCGTPRATGARMFFDYFYRVPVPVASLSRLCNATQGLAGEMLEVWLAAGGEPLSFGLEAQTPEVRAIADELQTLGLRDALVHGIPNAQSPLGVHCFFGFIALNRAPQRRERELAQAIVPHAFGAYCRALSRDRPAQAFEEAPALQPLVTEREVEILRWVREGKSNQEIGMILSISPLTVKNHVQKILRKLRASNRAQAVSKAIALRLLGNTGLPIPGAAGRLTSNG